MLEAPITVLVVCLVTLVTLQLGVWFHGYLVIHTISADLCRIVAVDDQIPNEMLLSYTNDRMQMFGTGVARQIPGSLSIEIEGNKRESIAVTVSMRQQPLPLIRTISAGLVPSTVLIEGVSRSQGSYHHVEGEPSQAPFRFGNVMP